MSIVCLQLRRKGTLLYLYFEFISKNQHCYVHLLQSKLIKALVIIKNDLIDWIKARTLFNLKAKTVAKLLTKNIIYCFKCFDSVVMNESLENRIVTEKLLNWYIIWIKLTSIYHSSINEMIKRKHWSLINILLKLIKDEIERWS